MLRKNDKITLYILLLLATLPENIQLVVLKGSKTVKDKCVTLKLHLLIVETEYRDTNWSQFDYFPLDPQILSLESSPAL